MDWVGGVSLSDVLAQALSGAELRVEHVAAYGKSILAALGYLHDSGCSSSEGPLPGPSGR
jgi:hypothetical protein